MPSLVGSEMCIRDRGLDGYVYSGGEAGQIYRISLNSGKVTEIANTGGFILGLALDASNNIYACDVSDRSIKKITPDGYVTTYATGTDEDPFITPNYPVFDSKGNLYVCDSGDWKQDNGKIFKISPGGISEVWDRRLKEFPNGICISPDEGYLVVAMSLNPPRIAKVLIDRDGNPDKIDTLVEIPGTVPDGVLFDRQGFIYVSCYRPDRIYRLSPLGDLEILADDFEGYHRIADALTTPIVGGENHFTHHDFKPFFASQKIPILQPDIMRGGYTELKVIAEHAHAAGIKMAPHLFPELNSHLNACIPNAIWLEYMGWFDHLWVNPLMPENGMLTPPDAPGHGLDFRPELFSEFPYKD